MVATRFPLFIFNQTIPILVEMFPNPKRIDISTSKVFSQTQTLGGWVFEHWGEQPQTIKVKGRTQGIVGDFKNELSVEASLFQLEQLYRLDKREMLSILPILKNPSTIAQFVTGKLDPSSLRTLSTTSIYYRYDVYTGFFTDFHWEQDAETNPRHYEYEFTFLATSTAQNMLADALFMPTTAAGALVRAAVGTAASVPAVASALNSITTGVGTLVQGL